MSTGFRRYIVGRVLVSIPMLFLLISIVFLAMHVLPGDPILATVGEKITYEQYLEMRQLWGLNQPVHLQFAKYLTDLLHFDLGISIQTRRSVLRDILIVFPATIELSVASMFVSLVIGLPLGVVGALKRNKLPDFLLRLVSLIGFGIPTFWLGMILQLAVALYIPGLLPMGGRVDPRIPLTPITGLYVVDSILTLNFPLFVDSIKHLILPALTLAGFNVALINRIARSNIIEVLDQDYVQTARAKGLKEITVLSKHAFKNAILPIFTVSGMNFARQLGGVLFVETVFSFPGLGHLLMWAVGTRDYSVIQGCVLVFGISVIVVSSLLDLSYAYLDPRIRYS